MNTTGTATALFLAANDRQATDMNVVSVSNTEQVGANIVSVRTTQRFLGSAPPASGSFALPAAVPAFTMPAQAGAPYPSWTANGSTPADYQGTSSTIMAIFTGQNAVSTVQATRAYLVANGQSTSYALATPILPNYQTVWAPASPLQNGTVSMTGASLTSAPVAGTVINNASRLQSPP